MGYSETKIIKSKRDCECHKCGTLIVRWAKCVFDSKSKTVKCLSCGEGLLNENDKEHNG